MADRHYPGQYQQDYSVPEYPQYPPQYYKPPRPSDRNMKNLDERTKRGLLIVGLIVLIVLIMLLAIMLVSSDLGWLSGGKQIAKFEGTGDTTTASFRCSGDWKIRWTTTYANESNAGFDFLIYSSYTDFDITYSCLEGDPFGDWGELAGGVLIHRTGKFYLLVFADNLISWEIIIEKA